MSDVQAALDAMAAAEREARTVVDEWVNTELSVRWARDRVVLVARDRATLQRHRAKRSAVGPLCVACHDFHYWPCPDARAVIDHWTRERG